MQAKFKKERDMIGQVYRVKQSYIFELQNKIRSPKVVIVDVIKKTKTVPPSWINPTYEPNEFDSIPRRYIQFAFIDSVTNEKTILDLPFRTFLNKFEYVGRVT